MKYCTIAALISLAFISNAQTVLPTTVIPTTISDNNLRITEDRSKVGL